MDKTAAVSAPCSPTRCGQRTTESCTDSHRAFSLFASTARIDFATGHSPRPCRSVWQ